jgi:hypothetical protein
MEYMLQRHCVDCGEKNPIVLEFDHRDPSEKKFAIGQNPRGRKLNDIIAEAQKCDVRCSNCHLIRTASQKATFPKGSGRKRKYD